MYIAIVGIVLINFVVLYCVRRRMKRELNSELNSRVQNAVSQYFALSSDARE